MARCRALLQEASGLNAGSADMRAFVEYADYIVALHRTALDDAGRPRQRLSDGEKLQASKEQALAGRSCVPCAHVPLLSACTRIYTQTASMHACRHATTGERT